jgi:hypothetical protein
MASANTLFGRSATLIVSSEAPIKDVGSAPVTVPTNGINLSELRFTFNISNGDTESPNVGIIRVYNLKKDTRQKIINEYDTVTLQVGYQNNVAIIFRGTIKQFVAGNENNVTSFLEIRAADGDPNYNFGLFGLAGQGVTMSSGWTKNAQLGHILTALGLPGDVNAADVTSATGGVNLAQVRGKTMFGLARAQASNLANTANARFSIQGGVVTFIPVTGYLPNQPVAINSLTGMVGTPETTDNGIQVTCLINPLIKIGCTIQINNAEITQTIIKTRVGLNQIAESAPFIADATEDGKYRVLVAEHSGDTRGQEWYTKITALSLDPTAKVTNAVKQFP